MSVQHKRYVELIPISQLVLSKRNARTHSGAQIKQIAKSIERFGFTQPVLTTSDNQIVAGHGRVQAAEQLGWDEVPCLRLGTLSKDEVRAYILADNKLAQNAGWDWEILATELHELLELNIDISLTGFTTPEVDIIMADASEASPKADGPEDDPPDPPPGSPVSRLGDHWILGRHALLCGDAKDPSLVQKLMGGVCADMLITDPPYNVRIDGHVSGLGQVRHREFAEASGEMSPAQFEAFLETTLGAAAAVCRNGAIAYTFMDWRHLREILSAGHKCFSELKNLCVWNKTNAGMGTFYRSQHELVLVWKVGADPHTNTFGLGDKGRYRSNVWTYAGANAFKTERMEEFVLHPTIKPVALIADAIRDVTHRGEIVLDVFGGSGSTLIAAQKTGRRARLLEIDPAYCDVIVKRWEKLTGKAAVMADDGRTFEEIQAARLPWPQPQSGRAA